MATFTQEQLDKVLALLAPQSTTLSSLSEPFRTRDQTTSAELKSVNGRIINLKADSEKRLQALRQPSPRRKTARLDVDTAGYDDQMPQASGPTSADNPSEPAAASS